LWELKNLEDKSEELLNTRVLSLKKIKIVQIEILDYKNSLKSLGMKMRTKAKN
jgi:hypothetical protein